MLISNFMVSVTFWQVDVIFKTILDTKAYKQRKKKNETWKKSYKQT